ncbi:MAG: Clp protease N-terminal domain-containing protein, partial [Polaribacter sp.]|nr:Clp protease N-terminal domain-containing protein [Polaribacter sp.]
MDDNFSPKVRDVITFSKEEALRLGHEFIGTEHLVLGLIRKGEGKAIEILTTFDVDLVLLRKKLEQLNPSNPTFSDNKDKPSLRLTRQAEKALKTTFLEAKLYQSESIDTAHLLLCILRNENDPTTKLIQKYHVNYDDVKTLYKQLHVDDLDVDLPSNPIAETPSDDEYASEKPNPFDQSQKSKTAKKSKTPVLDNFGRDLTDLAEKGKLDPVVGRQKEIERVSQILSRRKKNNPMLIGEPGVGKSAIAEGLALRIIERKVSRILFDKRIVSLDLASLVAGTKYRGQFEERMKALMNELEKNEDIILFIDE